MNESKRSHGKIEEKPLLWDALWDKHKQTRTLFRLTVHEVLFRLTQAEGYAV